MNIRDKFSRIIRRNNTNKAGKKGKSIPSEHEKEIIQQKMAMLNAASRQSR